MSTAPRTKLSEMPETPARRNTALNSPEPGTIGKSLIFKGQITGAESLLIEGRVEGSITLTGSASRVTVSTDGVVLANISAPEVVVLGELNGNVTASERIEVRKEGKFTGDVVTPRIVVVEGAFFKGKVECSNPS